MAQHTCSISNAQIRRLPLSHYRRPAIGVIVILVNPEREGNPMATSGANDQRSHIYLGLAGETGAGRVVQSGAVWPVPLDRRGRRMGGAAARPSRGSGCACSGGAPSASQNRLRRDTIGPYRSEDRGEHWQKLNIQDHGLPVWSFLFHPHDPDVIFIGYENCEIYRSDDAGEHWARLPVSVRFPEITTASGANPAKRVLMLDASVSEPDHLYAAIEVGGTIWENLSHGQYLNDDAVDMHGVLASRWRPGTVFGIGRAGMSCSCAGSGNRTEGF
jgi:hypothetical protein